MKASKKGDDMVSLVANLKAKQAKGVMETINRYKELALQDGKTDPNAFHDYMTKKDYDALVTAFLPLLKLEEITANTFQQGKYLVGTLKQAIQIKNNSLLIRVGGGYSTLEAYLDQNGPFECIKLSKQMRDTKCSFKEAVNFYLTKHKAPKKVIQDWLKSDDQNSSMFEAAIRKLEKA